MGEQNRWILWTPVGIGLGIWFYFSLQSEPSIVLPLIGCTAIWIIWYTARSYSSALVFVALSLATISIGFGAASWRTSDLQTVMLKKRMGPATLTGRVVSREHVQAGLRVLVDNVDVERLQRRLTPTMVQLRLRGNPPPLLPGDWVSLRTILSPPSPPAMPGSFDFQRRAYFKGIGAYGFNLGRVTVTSSSIDKGQRQPIELWIEQVRVHISEKIGGALAGPSGAIAVALTTGMRGQIPDELMTAIRDAGLAHLLAISGLHIGLVSGILFLSVRAVLALFPWITLHYPIKKWAAFIAIIGALSYSLISGSTVPTQRAFFMTAAVLIAIMLERRGVSMRLVAWAAVVILLLHPESLVSVSFQLSFAAVVALIAAYEALTKRRNHQNRITNITNSGKMLRYFGGVMLTTMIAGMSTSPIAIYHFNRFADYGMIANLIAVPITALWVMPLAIVNLLLIAIGFEPLAVQPMGWGIDIIIRVAETVASMPGAVTQVPTMPDWGLACFIAGGLWLCIWQGRWRLFGVGPMALSLISLIYITPPDLLIDGRGRVMAVRADDGNLVLSSVRAAKFETGFWLRQDGKSGEVSAQPTNNWQQGWVGEKKSLKCDISGCIYTTGPYRIALVKQQAALVEDCWSADLVISLTPVRKTCPAPLGTIDWFDLWRNGSHAVWAGEEGLKIVSVNESRGNRPWVIRPTQRVTALTPNTF